MSNNVTILMQKTDKISNFEYLYADWMLWKNHPEPLAFDEQFINKILHFVRGRQEKDLRDMDSSRNSQELYAIKVAQEDMYKELLFRISSLENVLRTVLQESSN